MAQAQNEDPFGSLPDWACGDANDTHSVMGIEGGPVIHIDKEKKFIVFGNNHYETEQRFKEAFKCYKQLEYDAIFGCVDPVLKFLASCEWIELEDYFEFSICSSPKGGIDIEVESRTVHLPKHCSVHHPVLKMVLLPRLKDPFSVSKDKDTFSCSHSVVLKAIIDIIGKSSLDACTTNVPIVYEAGWVAAKRDSAKSCNGEAYTLATSQSPTAGDGNWRPALWLDSGAAHHAVGDAGILINLRDPPTRITVRVADGSPLPVIKVGDIRTAHFEVDDVYLVPGLRVNLLSVRQLARKQIITTFYEHHAVLMRGLDKIGGAIADDEMSLYRMRYLTANLL